MKPKAGELDCDSPSVLNPAAKVRAKRRRPKPVVLQVTNGSVETFRALAEALGWKVREVKRRG